MSIAREDFSPRQIAAVEALRKELRISFSAALKILLDRAIDNESITNRYGIDMESITNRYEIDNESITNRPRARVEELSSPSGNGEGREKKKKKNTSVTHHPPEVTEVFQAWCGVLATLDEVPPDKPSKLDAIAINSRLKEGLPVSHLVDAVHGFRWDPWTERREPTKHLIYQLLKDRASVEKFRRFKLEAHEAARREAAEDEAAYEAGRKLAPLFDEL